MDERFWLRWRLLIPVVMCSGHCVAETNFRAALGRRSDSVTAEPGSLAVITPVESAEEPA